MKATKIFADGVTCSLLGETESFKIMNDALDSDENTCIVVTDRDVFDIETILTNSCWRLRCLKKGRLKIYNTVDNYDEFFQNGYYSLNLHSYIVGKTAVDALEGDQRRLSLLRDVMKFGIREPSLTAKMSFSTEISRLLGLGDYNHCAGVLCYAEKMNKTHDIYEYVQKTFVKDACTQLGCDYRITLNGIEAV